MALRMAPDPRQTRPFLPILEFIVGAQRAVAQGQNAQGVIEATTAIELLVNTVIREIGPRRDAVRYTPKKLSAVMETGFRGRLIDHYAVLLDAEPDLASDAEPIGRWWNHCYLLRNRAAHEGYRPPDQQAVAALVAAEELNAWTGRRLGEQGAADAAEGQ
jgi:hypothetical protein